jgi:hypothetical protein
MLHPVLEPREMIEHQTGIFSPAQSDQAIPQVLD